MLTDVIRARMKDAMRARDTVAKNVFRVALGEIQSAESRTGETLGDGEVARILRKLVKSNEESMAAVADGERREILAREVALLTELLPRTLSEAEITEALAPVLDAIRSAKSDGQATGVAMKHLQAAGTAVSGQEVARAVRSLRG